MNSNVKVMMYHYKKDYSELVYYYKQLSFVLPVIVGVMFTLLHALIQAYVLTMLTALFYGEVSEPSEKTTK